MSADAMEGWHKGALLGLIAAILIAAVLILVYSRYALCGSGPVYRLDRWTGKVVFVTPAGARDVSGPIREYATIPAGVDPFAAIAEPIR